jgi:hypothetical protein
MLAYKNEQGNWFAFNEPFSLPGKGVKCVGTQVLDDEGEPIPDAYEYHEEPDDLQVPIGWFESLTAEEREQFGVGVVTESQQPTDVIVTGAHVEETEAGELVLVWESEEMPLDQYKAMKTAEVVRLRDAAFHKGYLSPVGRLQVRDEKDRTNWLTSAQSYGAAVMAGQGAAIGATFRNQDDVRTTISYAQGYQILVQGMAKWGEKIMGRAWDLKDAIEDAPNKALVDAINLEEGWPE